MSTSDSIVSDGFHANAQLVRDRGMLNVSLPVADSTSGPVTDSTSTAFSPNRFRNDVGGNASGCLGRQCLLQNLIAPPIFDNFSGFTGAAQSHEIGFVEDENIGWLGNSTLATDFDDNNGSTVLDPDFRYSLFQTVVLGILAGSVSLVTITGNLVVIASFILERTIRQPTNYFIASLAVSDLLIGSISMPFYTIYLLSGKYWPLGEVLCDLWLSLDYTVCLVSIYTVFCITIDRFCSVKIPAKYRNWRTENKVLAIIAVTWLVPIVVFFTSINGWQYFVDGRTVPDGMCYVQYMDNPIFNTLLQVGYFWITLTVMCTLYAGIYRVALRLQQKSEAKQRKMASLVSVAGSAMSKIGIGVTQQQVIQQQQQPQQQSPSDRTQRNQPVMQSNGNGRRDSPRRQEEPAKSGASAAVMRRQTSTPNELSALPDDDRRQQASDRQDCSPSKFHQQQQQQCNRGLQHRSSSSSSVVMTSDSDAAERDPDRRIRQSKRCLKKCRNTPGAVEDNRAIVGEASRVPADSDSNRNPISKPLQFRRHNGSAADARTATPMDAVDRAVQYVTTASRIKSDRLNRQDRTAVTAAVGNCATDVLGYSKLGVGAYQMSKCRVKGDSSVVIPSHFDDNDKIDDVILTVVSQHDTPGRRLGRRNEQTNATEHHQSYAGWLSRPQWQQQIPPGSSPIGNGVCGAPLGRSSLAGVCPLYCRPTSSQQGRRATGALNDARNIHRRGRVEDDVISRSSHPSPVWVRRYGSNSAIQPLPEFTGAEHASSSRFHCDWATCRAGVGHSRRLTTSSIGSVPVGISMSFLPRARTVDLRSGDNFYGSNTDNDFNDDETSGYDRIASNSCKNFSTTSLIAFDFRTQFNDCYVGMFGNRCRDRDDTQYHQCSLPRRLPQHHPLRQQQRQRQFHVPKVPVDSHSQPNRQTSQQSLHASEQHHLYRHHGPFQSFRGKRSSRASAKHRKQQATADSSRSLTRSKTKRSANDHDDNNIDSRTSTVATPRRLFDFTSAAAAFRKKLSRTTSSRHFGSSRRHRSAAADYQTGEAHDTIGGGTLTGSGGKGRDPDVPSRPCRSSTMSAASKSENRALKALRTITIILGAFVLCFTPWHVLSLIISFYGEKGPISTLYDISYWLCYLNSPLNPFCYAFANQQFKKTFLRIIRLDWHRT